MESRAKLFGRPIRQMLIVFPLGLLATALVFDANVDAPSSLSARRVHR